jgi:hypothetical protein
MSLPAAPHRSLTRLAWLFASALAIACAEGEPLDADAFDGGVNTNVTIGTTTGPASSTGNGGAAGSGPSTTNATGGAPTTTGPTTSGTTSSTTGSTGSGGAGGSSTTGPTGGSSTTGGGRGGSGGSGSSTGPGGASGSGGSAGSGGRGGSGGSGGSGIGMCTAPAWVPTKQYCVGEKVSQNGKEYVAAFCSMGESPDTHHEPNAQSQSGMPWKTPTDC